MLRRNRRTVALVALALALMLLVSACGGQADQGGQPGGGQDEFIAAMATDVGGLGDQSFNDAAHRGLKRLEEETGATIKVLESAKLDDYEPNLTELANSGADITWAIGFLMADATAAVADRLPDKTFGIIDMVVEKPNVASVLFKENEGSFLVGVIAGMMTETNKIGFVGGMQSPVISRFEEGFKAGVKTVNPDAEVLIAYTGSFDNPSAGKEAANTQYEAGADIVFHAAGADGLGVIEAAKERGEGFYAIGVDSPQHHLAPDNVLASMVKRVDNAVFDISKLKMDGKFEAKLYHLGLKEEGVGVAYNPDLPVPDNVKQAVEEWRQKIINGDITVPATPEEYQNWTPPTQ